MWQPPKNKGGRPASWHTGKAPPGLGQEPEHHDDKGLFAAERAESSDWDAYMDKHPAGTTERRWDKMMTVEVKKRRKDLALLQKKRTDMSVAIYAADCDDHACGRRLASLREAYDTFSFQAGGLVDTLERDGSAHIVDLPSCAMTLIRGDVTQDQLDAYCDSLKTLCRRYLVEKHAAQRQKERKKNAGEFKLIINDIKILRDDISYLINKMRTCAYEYAKGELEEEDKTVKLNFGDSSDDAQEEYDLPDVKSVLIGLPSNNRLRRRDTVYETATAPDGDDASSIVTTNTEQSDAEEPPAKRLAVEPEGSD